jgi:hypothetical protein
LNDDGQELFGLGVLNIVIEGEVTLAQQYGGLYINGQYIFLDEGIDIRNNETDIQNTETDIQNTETNIQNRYTYIQRLCNIKEPILQVGQQLGTEEKTALVKYSAAQWENLQHSEFKQDVTGPANSDPTL